MRSLLFVHGVSFMTAGNDCMINMSWLMVKLFIVPYLTGRIAGMCHFEQLLFQQYYVTAI